MTPRKTPVLLRRAPISGGVNALTKYTYRNGGAILQAATDGKHDVTADFDALVLETLLDPDAADITAALDGAARGLDLNEAERAEVAAFRERLVQIIERHNSTGHGRRSRNG
jgi:hypothetical protein